MDIEHDKRYKEYIGRIAANDFARAFRDNSDQSDVQLVADYLRKIELSETVVQAVISLMWKHESCWTKDHERIIIELNNNKETEK